MRAALADPLPRAADARGMQGSRAWAGTAMWVPSLQVSVCTWPDEQLWFWESWSVSHLPL